MQDVWVLRGFFASMASKTAFLGIFTAILAEKWPYRAYNARFGHFLGKAGRKRRGFRARGRFRLRDMVWAVGSVSGEA